MSGLLKNYSGAVAASGCGTMDKRNGLRYSFRIAIVITLLASLLILTSSAYPALPTETYEIAYDTEFNANNFPDFGHPLRVRFTPNADGELVTEARIQLFDFKGHDANFQIRIVDVDTGITVSTPVIYEPWAIGWKVYDISNLGFYTSGDFYIEFWGTSYGIGVYADDTAPIDGRSERDLGAGWISYGNDLKIRAVLKPKLEPVPAMVDVKPDTLNKASQGGTVTAYIEILGYDVNDIDVSTVILSTINGKISAQLSSTEVGDYDSDGIPDLMVKFDKQAVIGIVDIGDHVKLTISGMVSGLKFEGSDEIRVNGKEETPLPPPPVPEQSTIVLVSGGLLGILLVLRRSG